MARPDTQRETFLVFGAPSIGEEEIAEVVDSLAFGWIGTGPKVKRFERDARGVPRRRRTCAASPRARPRCCSACARSGSGPGDEVLVPAMTFVASANAVEHVGATPVLVDSEPGTGLIDLDAAEAAITPRTKAIMPVHLAGRPVDLDRLNALRDRHGLLVIEDAAHAIGAEWRGAHDRHARQPRRLLVLRDEERHDGRGRRARDRRPGVAERVERLALHGLSLGAWQRFSDAGLQALRGRASPASSST